VKRIKPVISIVKLKADLTHAIDQHADMQFACVNARNRAIAEAMQHKGWKGITPLTLPMAAELCEVALPPRAI
jgi:hypothetical protein